MERFSRVLQHGNPKISQESLKFEFWLVTKTCTYIMTSGMHRHQFEGRHLVHLGTRVFSYLLLHCDLLNMNVSFFTTFKVFYKIGCIFYLLASWVYLAASWIFFILPITWDFQFFIIFLLPCWGILSIRQIIFFFFFCSSFITFLNIFAMKSVACLTSKISTYPSLLVTEKLQLMSLCKIFVFSHLGYSFFSTSLEFGTCSYHECNLFVFKTFYW